MKKNGSSPHNKIALLGLGHIGLPTALGFAEAGHQVLGVDTDAATINRLKQGETTFYEPGLKELLHKHLTSSTLTLTTDVEDAIRQSSILFICVGTPQRNDGRADLSQVETLAQAISRNLNSYKLIVEKSTVPALTGQALAKAIRRYAEAATRQSSFHDGSAAQDAVQFDVASNPEFLQEGKALENIFHPDRIVCGVTSERARAILSKLYEPLGAPIVFTDLNTAEIIKYASNAFLATKISFINMVSDLCDSVGADVTKVALGMGLDPRIGKPFLNAGLGFGGYCFPKDVAAFIRVAQDAHVDTSLLKAIEGINQARIDVFVDKVRQATWTLNGKTLAVLGLAFKAGTDDIRCAPSLKIIEALRKEGATVRAFDPQAMHAVRRLLADDEGVRFCNDPYEACSGAAALLVLTEWEEFRQLDFNRVRRLLQVPVVIDGRNLYDPGAMRQHGFEYISMGRPIASAAPLENDYQTGTSNDQLSVAAVE